MTGSPATGRVLCSGGFGIPPRLSRTHFESML